MLVYYKLGVRRLLFSFGFSDLYNWGITRLADGSGAASCTMLMSIYLELLVVTILFTVRSDSRCLIEFRLDDIVFGWCSR